MGDTIRTLRLLSMLAVAAVGLAACARNAPPAPVEVKGQQNYGRAASLAASSRSGMDDMILVQRGDTLYGLARKHNVPTQELIVANGLRAPYGLQVGQRLSLPHAQRANTHPATPAVQAVEMIPAGSVPPAIPAGKVESAPLAPISSAPAGPPAATAEPAPPTVTSQAAEPAARPVDQAAAQSEGSADPKAPEAPTQAQTAALRRQMEEVEPASAALPARAGSGFIWPVRGRVVSDFGSKGGGLHNDGINIAAARGTPIRAAENGVVVYAGNELRGFGNLVLLRHAGGWMTAYGHADTVTVERGDQVRRGQVIGRVGATGNVTSPQVHFEIRRGSRPVNPREHLLSESASAE